MKRNYLLPLLAIGLLLLSRIPGLLPHNFSAVYALVFCAGVYFPCRATWWVVFPVLLASDLGLGLYYYQASAAAGSVGPSWLYLAGNYVGYAGLWWLGRKFSSKDHFLSLLGGGLAGALLFYLLTNTVSWFLNPFHNLEYTKSLAGWLTALTRGTAGYPQTWEFFRNTLMSGGLFTALFAGTMQLSEPERDSTAEQETGEPTGEPVQEAQA